MATLAPRPSALRPATRRGAPGPLAGRALTEPALLLLAPLLAVALLRVRLMAPTDLADPAMHSVYLWDPGDLARRYRPSVLPPSLRDYIGPVAAYLRWGDRPGFLVPGRLAYLAFGTVPGFLAFRYVLALIATIPTYLLGKRTHGPGIGALGVCLVLASPVVITAWGTDFPDSAAISYLLGGLACLVMPCRSQAGRRRWQLIAAVLLTTAVWSLATTVVLVLAAVAVAAAQTGVLRGWAAMAGDLIRLAAGAMATTLVLGFGSWLVLGRLDYVLPTIQAVLFLSTPAQAVYWHSSNWRWAPLDTYLLVLPATCLAWALPALRRRLSAPALAIGAVATLQLTAAAAGQFAGSLQLLEEHYLSSPLWAASLLTLMFVLAELSRPLQRHVLARWLPAALVIAAALLLEAAPPVPAFGWMPWGLVLAVLVVAVTAATAWHPRRRRRHRSGTGPTGRAVAAAAATAAILGATLALTVAPRPASAHLPRTVYDPPTDYRGALGGASATLIDNYRLEQAVRAAVPNASYRGEQLVDCVTRTSALALELNLVALFHNTINFLGDQCPSIGSRARAEIRSRDVAQLVAMAPDGRLDVAALLAQLAGLRPRLSRLQTLSAGDQSVTLAVIDFPAAGGPSEHP